MQILEFLISRTVKMKLLALSVIAILLSFLTVGFATSVIIGGGYEKFDKEENSIGITIGTIAFFIGIFLMNTF
jgi:hypothetical protein